MNKGLHCRSCVYFLNVRPSNCASDIRICTYANHNFFVCGSLAACNNYVEKKTGVQLSLNF